MTPVLALGLHGHSEGTLDLSRNQDACVTTQCPLLVARVSCEAQGPIMALQPLAALPSSLQRLYSYTYSVSPHAALCPVETTGLTWSLLEALGPSRDSRARTRSPSPRAQLLQMLFEEALPLRGSDAVLSTLSLVQVRPWGRGNLGNQDHGDAAIGPETRGLTPRHLSSKIRANTKQKHKIFRLPVVGKVVMLSHSVVSNSLRPHGL